MSIKLLPVKLQTVMSLLQVRDLKVKVTCTTKIKTLFLLVMIGTENISCAIIRGVRVKKV